MHRKMYELVNKQRLGKASRLSQLYCYSVVTAFVSKDVFVTRSWEPLKQIYRKDAPFNAFTYERCFAYVSESLFSPKLEKCLIFSIDRRLR